MMTYTTIWRCRVTANDELSPAVVELLRNAPYGQIATLMPGRLAAGHAGLA